MAAIATDLEVRVWGERNPERVILLHGVNTPDAARTWQEQLPLADEHELLVVSRRGFRGSPSAERITWDSEMADILALVGERAHLVGHSYGAVEALLFAGRYPERVRSLVAIEPPAYGVALDDPGVAALQSRLGPIHAAGSDLPPEEFLRRFVAVFDEEVSPDLTLEGDHRRALPQAHRLGGVDTRDRDRLRPHRRAHRRGPPHRPRHGTQPPARRRPLQRAVARRLRRRTCVRVRRSDTP